MTNVTKDWSRFALLMIDVQNDFVKPDTRKFFPHLEQNISKLMALCRSEGIEVINVRAVFKKDMSDWIPTWKLKGYIPCVEGTTGIDFLPCAMPNPGEKVITKHSHDAFLFTDLQEYLDSRGKRFLLTAGVSSTVCVFLTTASASQRGFMTAIIEDCTAGEPEAHFHQLLKNDLYFRHVPMDQIKEKHSDWAGELKRLSELERANKVAI